MGVFRKVSAYTGHEDKKLLERGVLVPGLVVTCEPTSVSVGAENSPYGASQVCRVKVEIHGLPSHEPYQAECVHAIPRIYIPQMQQAGATVAVRVDPDDPQHIELDLATQPPPLPSAVATGVPETTPDEVALPTNPDGSPIQTHRSKFTADQILAHGKPCRAEITAAVSLGQKDSQGRDAIGFQLQVFADGEQYEVQIGVGVPAAAAPLVYEGAVLPAKVLADEPQMVAIDWDSALAEAGISSGSS